jgi:hypothetical protein
MRVEPLIHRHLYQNKKVTLQNIGTFYLSPEVVINDDPEKEVALPENAITFEVDKNAKPDDALIDFIMQQTKKIKPLAASDLESYTMLSVQFLNIGKPLEIKGIGYLQKNQSGQYEFTQSDTIDNKLTDLSVHSEHTEESGSPNFSTPAKIKSKNKWILPFSLIILTFGVMIYLYMHYSNNNNETEPIVTDTIEIKKDTIPATINDSINITPDSLKTSPLNTSGFSVVVKEFNSKTDAEKSLKKLIGFGHNLTLQTTDSLSYKLIMSFSNPLADTTRILDSLRRNFGEVKILR